MTKAMARSLPVALALALALGTAYAQPAPPASGDAAGSSAGSGSGSGSATKPGEKADMNESLQNGSGTDRPWARGVTKTEQQAALALFHDGNLELNDGLFAKAADKYKLALKHWDHPAIHYNLALALMNIDQPINAYDNLQLAIKYGAAPLQSKDKLDNAKRYLKLLNEQIAEVEVTCMKPGAKVSVDGKPVFVGPGTYKSRVRAGRHTFVAELEGHPTKITAPYISPGAPFRIELKLYTVAELTRYRRRWKSTWAPYTVIGAGVVVGLVGGGMEIAAQNTFHNFDSTIAKCNTTSSGSGCTASSDLVGMKNRGNMQRTLGYVGYGVAAGAVITGAVLAYLNRSTPYQIRPEDMDAEQGPAVSVAPMLGPDTAGAMVLGHF